MMANPVQIKTALRLLLAAALAASVIRVVAAEPTGASDQANPASAESGDAAVEKDNHTAIQSQVTSPPESAGGASSSRVIEEIVVTAQKREENIQDVPISIAAFSGNQLEALGIDNAKALGTVIPALQIADFAGYSLVYIRGVGTDSFFPSADPSVATYIDGIYFPSAHTLGEGFGKVQRIEVLKGPQGTLFGRNATGGAINIITQDPSFTTEGEVQAGYGRFDDLKTRGFFNFALNDQFAINVSGIYNRGDSYYTRDATLGLEAGQPLRKDRTGAGRVKLRYAPNENMNLVFTAIESQAIGAGSALSVNTHPSLVGSLLGIQPETREFVTATDDNPGFDNLTRAYYGVFTWHLPFVDMKLQGSRYKVATSKFVVDFDGSPEPLVTSTGVYEFQRNNTAELQLTSNKSSWGSSWLQYTAGVYYYQSSGGYLPVRLSLANTAVRLPTGQVLQLVPQSLLSLLGAVPAPDRIEAFLTGTVGAQSYSGYLQFTVKPLDWFDLTLGGRYQSEKRNVIESTIAEQNADGSLTTLLPWPRAEDRRTKLTPKATIDLHLIDNVLFYATYQKGIKSATYNVVNVDKPPDFVKPEEVTAYEIGAKSTLLDGNLRLNGAVFQNNVKNLQASYVSLFSGGLATFLNVGAARVRGIEFDFLAVPLSGLDRGLALTGGASFLDPRYTNYSNAAGYNTTTGFNQSNNDYTGNQIIRTSRVAGSLGLSQTIEMGGGILETGADLSYRSGFYFQPSETVADRQASYLLLNARVSYLYEPWGVRLTAFGANLTDKRYDIAQFRTDFGRLDTLAPPITYGGNLSLSF